MKKRALGKGLDALLSPVGDASGSDPGVHEQIRILPVDIVVRGQHQPRMEMAPEALEDLSKSIQAQGVMQPIIVRPLPDTDNYEIIAGERRWRATQLAGLHEIPAIVKNVTDQTAMCLALIENIQREDLNPIDEARALARLLQESKMTHDTIAKAIGRSRSTVSNLLRLLDLHSDVQKMLESGIIEMGHGRAILSLELSKQLGAATKTVQQGLSVRQTERLVQQLKKGKGEGNHASGKQKDANVEKLQQDLSAHLGVAVTIDHRKNGTGKLEISYHSLDELQGILQKIK